MYSEQDLSVVRLQLKRRRLLVWLPAAVAAAGILLNVLFLRTEWLTYLLFVVSGFILVFGLDFFVKPVKKYAEFIDLALHGRSRESEAVFCRFDEDVAERDGVKVFPLIMSAGDPENEKDDRLYYYDALLDRPGWKAGDRLLITYHDKFIVFWKKTV